MKAYFTQNKLTKTEKSLNNWKTYLIVLKFSSRKENT